MPERPRSLATLLAESQAAEFASVQREFQEAQAPEVAARRLLEAGTRVDRLGGPGWGGIVKVLSPDVTAALDLEPDPMAAADGLLRAALVPAWSHGVEVGPVVRGQDNEPWSFTIESPPLRVVAQRMGGAYYFRLAPSEATT